eukprot:GHVQ01003602.1.p1 GENE.GHVQ01003602.1~~GHVQ01003602.1.p1  ORF type:complete len:309 (-),score=22.74 GHVQ01003602.1:50-976(-)
MSVSSLSASRSAYYISNHSRPSSPFLSQPSQYSNHITSCRNNLNPLRYISSSIRQLCLITTLLSNLSCLNNSHALCQHPLPGTQRQLQSDTAAARFQAALGDISLLTQSLSPTIGVAVHHLTLQQRFLSFNNRCPLRPQFSYSHCKQPAFSVLSPTAVSTFGKRPISVITYFGRPIVLALPSYSNHTRTLTGAMSSASTAEATNGGCALNNFIGPVGLDPFAHKQFDDPKYSGTRISNPKFTPGVFLKQVNDIIKAHPVCLVEGYVRLRIHPQMYMSVCTHIHRCICRRVHTSTDVYVRLHIHTLMCP